jgi:GxxExxY protein
MTEENKVAKAVVQAAFEIHTELGPGLLESVYEVLMWDLLKQKGFSVDRQRPIPIILRGIRFEEGFRADLVVNDKVLVELKSVEALANLHKKQVLTYLRLSGLRLGLLINFNSVLIKDGIRRIANGLPDEPLGNEQEGPAL